MAGPQHAVTAELDAGPDVDDEELAELTGRLRGALLELDVDAVEPASGGAAPEGAKGVELLAIGGLVIRFAMSSAMLRSVVDVASGWMSRQQARSVKLTLDGDTLEVTGTSSEEQQRLIDLWVARHARDG
jgi:hypothetical protein